MTDNKIKLEDEVLRCIDCGADFVFTAAEARYYIAKLLTVPPKRCPTCRRLRRASIVPDPELERQREWP